MPVIEYKLHAVDQSQALQAPHWVIDGGHWYNPADRTLVGWTPAEEDRAYWVPDNVTTLTKEEVNTRILAIHAERPFQKINNDSVNEIGTPYGEQMTEAEVTTMSNDWYDAYIGGK